MDSAPPILTNINPKYLECTLHSEKYHCLLRLHSNRSVKRIVNGSNASFLSSSTMAAAATSSRNNAAMPDISSLSAIPIVCYAGHRNVGNIQDFGQTKTGNRGVIRLLPKLFNDATPTNDKEDDSSGHHDANGNDNVSNSNANAVPNNHPSHELIRITRDLEVHLKERLKDASDGAMMLQHATDNNGSSNNIGPTTTSSCTISSASGIQEEFLLRSEAIMLELLSAVQQQHRKEEQTHQYHLRHRSGTSNNGDRSHVKRLKSMEQSTISKTTTTTISTTTSPPLKYYSALVRQLQTLQSMTHVKDISLPKKSSSTTTTGTIPSSSSDLTRLSVTCVDEKKRVHIWHAELYPSIVLTMDLPSEFVLEEKQLRLEKWWEDGGVDSASNPTQQGSNNNNHGNNTSGSSQTLPKIHQLFTQTLQKYQPLFTELDDLDTHLWILEPSLPARRSVVERRIALWEGGASMVIALDPDNARGIPVMVRFLGVTLATMKAAASATANVGGEGMMMEGVGGVGGVAVDWRTSFAEFVLEEEEEEEDDRTFHNKPTTTNPKRWSETRSVRENLELWFGSSLPSPLSPSTTEKSDYLVECGICYAHRLPTEEDDNDPDSKGEGPLPEVKCSNSSCNRHYHESCLFEWLHSLPTARVSFDRIFGACPYCCEPVSVKIANGVNNH